VRFAFRELPDPGAASVRARPIVDVVVEGSTSFLRPA